MRGSTCVAAFAAAFAAVAVPPAALAQPTFTPLVIDATGSGNGKAVGDIDLDGKGDAVLGGASLAWYEAGAGWARRVIRAAAVNEFTFDLQAVDVDADGDVDVIGGDGASLNNVLWFENPVINPPAGRGSDPRVEANWAQHEIGTHGAVAHDIEVADVNRDGRLDVLTSGFGRTHLWIQSSPTSWTGREMTTMTGATLGVFFADIDRDGRLDIAVPRGWWRAPEDALAGTWTHYPVTAATDGDEVVAADLNGDGRVDLATTIADGPGVLAWFEAPADPTLPDWTRRVIDASMGGHHPEARDFDGDGRLDLLMGEPHANLSVFFNQGGSPPSFFERSLDTASALNARSGDLDGDGDLDVFSADGPGEPPAKVYMNSGLAAPAAIRLFTVAPCRLVDTRQAVGPRGGPALFALSERTFTLSGICNVPTSARALVLNITINQPTAAGHLTMYPAGTAPPRASVLNFVAGATRANNATIPVAAGGHAVVYLGQTTGTAHVIIDVTGYYQ
jgi:hypothetical protein